MKKDENRCLSSWERAMLGVREAHCHSELRKNVQRKARRNKIAAEIGHCFMIFAFILSFLLAGHYIIGCVFPDIAITRR